MGSSNGHRGRADEPQLVEAKMEHVEPDVPETPPARGRLVDGQSKEHMDEVRLQRLHAIGLERAA